MSRCAVRKNYIWCLDHTVLRYRVLLFVMPHCYVTVGKLSLTGIFYQEWKDPGGHCYWDGEHPKLFCFNLAHRTIGISISRKIGNPMLSLLTNQLLNG